MAVCGSCEELSVFGVFSLVCCGKWGEFGCIGFILLDVNLIRDKEDDYVSNDGLRQVFGRA